MSNSPKWVETAKGVFYWVCTLAMIALVILAVRIDQNLEDLSDMDVNFASMEGHLSVLPGMDSKMAKMEESLSLLPGISDRIARIEERIKDISDIKSGVDKLLGANNIVKVIPEESTSFNLDTSGIIIPSWSVAEPVWFEFTEYYSLPLPEELPENYKFLNWALRWKPEDVILEEAAEVKVNLGKIGLPEIGFEELVLLYRNVFLGTWEEIPIDIDQTANLLFFDTGHTGIYVLAQELKP